MATRGRSVVISTEPRVTGVGERSSREPVPPRAGVEQSGEHQRRDVLNKQLRKGRADAEQHCRHDRVGDTSLHQYPQRSRETPAPRAACSASGGRLYCFISGTAGRLPASQDASASKLCPSLVSYQEKGLHDRLDRIDHVCCRLYGPSSATAAGAHRQPRGALCPTRVNRAATIHWPRRRTHEVGYTRTTEGRPYRLSVAHHTLHRRRARASLRARQPRAASSGCNRRDSVRCCCTSSSAMSASSAALTRS